VETGQIASKMQAMEHVSIKYPQHAPFMRLLSAIYTNDEQTLLYGSSVTKENIRDYLSLVPIC
jgi:hypothetical protein